MSSLFWHSFSQGLQAFMPLAAALAWFGCAGERRPAAAIRLALLVSIPATFAATWRFQMSSRRALDEAILALIALAIAAVCARTVWRTPANGRRATSATANDNHEDTTRAFVASWCLLLLAAALIVVRQTMEIGVSFAAAAFEIRSRDATATVIGAAAAAAVIAWISRRAARALPRLLAVTAIRTFALVFLAQVAIYAFHESAEARLLPWSDVLHAATEPYGPDGVYGMHFSDLLVAVPIAAVLLAIGRARLPLAQATAWWTAVQRRAVVASLVAAAFVWMTVQRTDARPPRAAAAVPAADIAAIAARPHVVFRNTASGPTFGRLTIAPLDALDTRLPAALACERVSFAAGHGLCLHTERGVFNTHSAVLIDRALNGGASFKLDGLPSRTRTSPDGRLGAITVFVVGDDYAANSFSTRTTIVDLSSGDQIGELEQFTTWRNGARFKAADFNFWGVTFAKDGSTFYASLRTGGTTFLVRGELVLRKLTVVREGAECPALSPDGRRLAYKKRVGPSPDAWRLHVLDLETNTEQILTSETRYINDQVEWLDPTHVLYGIPRRTTSIVDVWVAPIDGSAPARVFLSEAESPIVVR
ncbi:MAG TPA: hypothetical protein VH417_13300 [Vicinamibacterales bacterium]